MFGQYKHTMDAKGRLIVPSKLREELGESFYISKSPDACLTVYTREEWGRVLERFKALPMTAGRGLRYFMANVWQCEPDKQGRFLLPEKYRAFAEIQQDVIFLGLGDRAEIWAAEKYEAQEAEHLTPEAIEQALKELGF